MTTYFGDFEVHLTVPAEGAEVDRLAAVAEEHGLKFVHILLARGETVSQPMLTYRGSGALAGPLRSADGLVDFLGDAGFPVSRVKIEYSPHADGVPRTAGDVGADSDQLYFEHHIKLVLDEEPAGTSDLAELAELAAAHRAHLSRNARRVRADGRSERFVTQRVRRAGEDVAVERLDRLTRDLTGHGYEILSVEREYVVHDSAPSVDAGWIIEEGGLS